MSQESQKIAALRDRLTLIESTQINENPFKAGANLIKNFKSGLSGGKARTPAGTFAPGASAAGMANRGGKTVAANPVKTAAATGAVGVAAGAGGVAALSGGAATKPADASGAPAGPNNDPAASALAPEEQKELDALAAELEVHMGRLPELDSLLLQHQKLAQGGAATKPTANPELDAIKKNAGIPASANDGNAGEAEAQANMAAMTKKADPTGADAAAAVKAAGKDPAQLQKGPAPAPGGTTTTTQSTQSVQGTMRMGKPDGPITFNGKVVNPGQPEYAAASDALIKSQGAGRAARTGAAPGVPAAPAAPATPDAKGVYPDRKGM